MGSSSSKQHRATATRYDDAYVVRTVTLDPPDHGLTEEVLAGTARLGEKPLPRGAARARSPRGTASGGPPSGEVHGNLMSLVMVEAVGLWATLAGR